jgi:hypothetical protein
LRAWAFAAGLVGAPGSESRWPDSSRAAPYSEPPERRSVLLAPFQYIGPRGVQRLSRKSTWGQRDAAGDSNGHPSAISLCRGRHDQYRTPDRR